MLHWAVIRLPELDVSFEDASARVAKAEDPIKTFDADCHQSELQSTGANRKCCELGAKSEGRQRKTAEGIVVCVGAGA